MCDHELSQERCHQASPLDERDLIAAADGEADERVLAHLGACPACAARVESLIELQGALRRRLFRALCPPSEELLAYHEGSLAGQRRAALAGHLAECIHCAREVDLLAKAGRTALPLPPPRRPLRQLVAELLAPRPQPLSGALYGALRSGSVAHYAYRTDDVQIALEVARAVAHPGRLVLSGSLTIDGDLPPEGVTAALLRSSEPVTTVALDELGGFVADDLAPGEYTLLLRLPDVEVVVKGLSL